VRIERFNGSGVSGGSTYQEGPPFERILPTNPPSMRVIKVATADVPAVPGAGFQAPDVSIDAASPSTITIEGRNVPVGTVVTLVIIPESGPDIFVDSTPLAGSLALSTATATVAVPAGNSLMYVRSKWT
jgi:hypothetical protein